MYNKKELTDKIKFLLKSQKNKLSDEEIILLNELLSDIESNNWKKKSIRIGKNLWRLFGLYKLFEDFFDN